MKEVIINLYINLKDSLFSKICFINVHYSTIAYILIVNDIIRINRIKAVGNVTNVIKIVTTLGVPYAVFKEVIYGRLCYFGVIFSLYFRSYKEILLNDLLSKRVYLNLNIAIKKDNRIDVNKIYRKIEYDRYN